MTIHELSYDQEEAINNIIKHLSENNEAVLAGAAGTGKTTTLLRLLDRVRYSIMFFTPTGKAALRVKEQTGRGCSTIHSGFFTSVDESETEAGGEKLTFSEPSPPEGSGRNTLWVIDESSMIGRDIARTIREMRELVGCKILWVGDDEQLPPVEGNWGVDFKNATGRLTTVHRQKEGSNILDLATLTRQGKSSEFTAWQNDTLRVVCEVHDAVLWYDAVPYAGLITFTNKTRKLANFLYRRHKKYPQQEIVPGETLLVTMNNRDKGLVNGQQVKVAEVTEFEDMSLALRTRVQRVTIERNHVVRGKLEPYQQVVFCLPEIFDADTKEMSENKLLRSKLSRLYDTDVRHEVREDTGWDTYEIRLQARLFKDQLIQCTWGYCLTVHKSQGSQWDDVGFISCGFFRKTLTSDPDFGKRLYYTAITRAAKQYVEFVCSFIPNVKDLIEDKKQTVPTPTGGNTMIASIQNIFTKGGKICITSKSSGNSHTFILSKAKGKDFFFVNYAKTGPSNYMGIFTQNGFRTTKASKYVDGSVEVKTLRWIHSTLQTNPQKLLSQGSFSF